MLQLCFAFPQRLFFLWGFVEFIPSVVYMRELWFVFLFVLVLEVLQNWVYVVTCTLHTHTSPRFVLDHINLLEKVGVHCVLLPRLLELLLCGTELIYMFVLLVGVQLGTMRFLLQNSLLACILTHLDIHSLEILMLQDSSLKKDVLSSCRSLSGRILQHWLYEVNSFWWCIGDEVG